MLLVLGLHFENHGWGVQVDTTQLLKNTTVPWVLTY